jgi:hypothetical protein
MVDHTPSQAPDTGLIASSETTKIRHLEEDDTQVIEIDCVYTTWLLSEIESEPEFNDPEEVELIGHNVPLPRS